MNPLQTPVYTGKSGVYRGAHYIECEWSLEPHRGGYNEHAQSIFGTKIRKIPQIIN